MDSIDNANKLNASGIDYGTIKLEWPFVMNTVKHYIYRADFEIDKETKFEYIGKTADICEFTDKNAVPGKQYIYRVKYGNDEDIFTTPYPDTVFENAPIPPPTFTLGFNSVTLRWTNIDGAVRYNVYRMEPNGKSDEAKKFAYVGFCTFPVFTDNKVSANTKYIYRIKIGFSETLFKSWIENTTVETLPMPDQPRFTNVRFNSVTFEWTHIDGTVKYNIYRREPDSKEPALNEFKYIRATSATSFTDEKLKQKTKYIYRIKNGDENDKFTTFYKDFSITTPARPEIMDFKYDLGKLPYLDGAESQSAPRGKAITVARMLAAYDIISFDIFDTLVLRPFTTSSDLFMLAEHKLGIAKFHKIRIRAEKEARAFAQLTRGNREVTIYDIYAIIENETGLAALHGIQTELDIELDLCRANPYMKLLFDLLKHHNKRLIVICDSYWPEDMIKKLLNSCGYDGFERIFASCNYACDKESGRLFEIAKNNMDSDKIIHIGTDKNADDKIAKKNGFDTRSYNSIGNRGNPFRASGMSHIFGSAYASIVNNHLHNGVKIYSPYYESGFIYAGLYTMGFCVWCHDYAKRNNLDKLLFVSGTGDIYDNVYNILFNDISCVYLYWSETSDALLSMEANRHRSLHFLFDMQANVNYKTRISDLFRKFGLDDMKIYLSDYNLAADVYISHDNLKICKKLITDHWDNFTKCYNEVDDNSRDYIINAIGSSKRIAIVDVRWDGDTLSLKHLIEKKYKLNCEAHYLRPVLNNAEDYSNITTDCFDNNIETYIFSPYQNKYLHDFHTTTNNKQNSRFFEMMMPTLLPPFVWIKHGDFIFDMPITENFEYSDEIYNGIIDFVKIYSQTFIEYPYMLRISGHDAYMPFMMLIKDTSFIKKYFGDK